MTEIKIKSCGVVIGTIVSEKPFLEPCVTELPFFESDFNKHMSCDILEKFFADNGLPKKYKLTKFIYGFDGDIIIHCNMPLNEVRDFKLNKII